jgi:hypothetical protein
MVRASYDINMNNKTLSMSHSMSLQQRQSLGGSTGRTTTTTSTSNNDNSKSEQPSVNPNKSSQSLLFRSTSSAILRQQQHPAPQPQRTMSSPLKSPYSMTTTCTTMSTDEGTCALSVSSADYSDDHSFYQQDRCHGSGVDECLPLLSQDEDEEDCDDEHDGNRNLLPQAQASVLVQQVGLGPVDHDHAPFDLLQSSSMDSLCSCATPTVDNTTGSHSLPHSTSNTAATSQQLGVVVTNKKKKKPPKLQVLLSTSKSKKNSNSNNDKRGDQLNSQSKLNANAHPTKSMSSSKNAKLLKNPATKRPKFKQLKKSLSVPASALKNSQSQQTITKASSLSSSKSWSSGDNSNKKEHKKRSRGGGGGGEGDVNNSTTKTIKASGSPSSKKEDSYASVSYSYSPPREAMGETYVFDDAPTVAAVDVDVDDTFDPDNNENSSNNDSDSDESLLEELVGPPTPTPSRKQQIRRQLIVQEVETLQFIPLPPRCKSKTKTSSSQQQQQQDHPNTPLPTASSFTSRSCASANTITSSSQRGPYSTLLSNFMDLSTSSQSQSTSTSHTTGSDRSSSPDSDIDMDKPVEQQQQRSASHASSRHRRFVLRDLSQLNMNSGVQGHEEEPYFNISFPPEFGDGDDDNKDVQQPQEDVAAVGVEVEAEVDNEDEDDTESELNEWQKQRDAEMEMDLEDILNSPPPPPPSRSTSPMDMVEHGLMVSTSSGEGEGGDLLAPLVSLVRHNRQLSIIEEEQWMQMSSGASVDTYGSSPRSPTGTWRKECDGNTSNSSMSPERHPWKKNGNGFDSLREEEEEEESDDVENDQHEHEQEHDDPSLHVPLVSTIEAALSSELSNYSDEVREVAIENASASMSASESESASREERQPPSPPFVGETETEVPDMHTSVAGPVSMSVTTTAPAPQDLIHCEAAAAADDAVVPDSDDSRIQTYNSATSGATRPDVDVDEKLDHPDPDPDNIVNDFILKRHARKVIMTQSFGIEPFPYASEEEEESFGFSDNDNDDDDDESSVSSMADGKRTGNESHIRDNEDQEDDNISLSVSDMEYPSATATTHHPSKPKPIVVDHATVRACDTTRQTTQTQRQRQTPLIPVMIKGGSPTRRLGRVVHALAPCVLLGTGMYHYITTTTMTSFTTLAARQALTMTMTTTQLGLDSLLRMASTHARNYLALALRWIEHDLQRFVMDTTSYMSQAVLFYAEMFQSQIRNYDYEMLTTSDTTIMTDRVPIISSDAPLAPWQSSFDVDVSLVHVPVYVKELSEACSQDVDVDFALVFDVKELWTESVTNVHIYLDLLYMSLSQPWMWGLLIVTILTMHTVWKWMVHPFLRLLGKGVSLLWKTLLLPASWKKKKHTDHRSSVAAVDDVVGVIPSHNKLAVPSELNRKDSWLTKLYNVVNSGSNLSTGPSHYHQFQNISGGGVSGGDTIDTNSNVGDGYGDGSGSHYRSNTNTGDHHDDDCSTLGSASLSPPKMMRDYSNTAQSRGRDVDNDYYNRYASRRVIDEYDCAGELPTNNTNSSSGNNDTSYQQQRDLLPIPTLEGGTSRDGRPGLDGAMCHTASLGVPNQQDSVSMQQRAAFSATDESFNNKVTSAQNYSEDASFTSAPGDSSTIARNKKRGSFLLRSKTSRRKSVGESSATESSNSISGSNSGSSKGFTQAMKSALMSKRSKRKELTSSTTHGLLSSSSSSSNRPQSLRKSTSNTSMSSMISSRPSLASSNERSNLSVSFNKRNNETVLFNIDRPPSALDGAASTSSFASADSRRGTRSQNSSPLNIGGKLFSYVGGSGSGSGGSTTAGSLASSVDPGQGSHQNIDDSLASSVNQGQGSQKHTIDALASSGDQGSESQKNIDDGPKQFYTNKELVSRGLSVPNRPKPTAVHARTKTMAASVNLNGGSTGMMLPTVASPSSLAASRRFEVGQEEEKTEEVMRMADDAGVGVGGHMHPLMRRSPSPPNPDLPKPHTRTFTAPVDMFSSNIMTRGETLVDDADTGGSPQRTQSDSQSQSQSWDNSLEGTNSLRSLTSIDPRAHKRRVPVLRPELLVTDSYDSDEETLMDDLDDESFVALMDNEQLNRAVTMDVDSFVPMSAASPGRGTSVRQQFYNSKSGGGASSGTMMQENGNDDCSLPPTGIHSVSNVLLLDHDDGQPTRHLPNNYLSSRTFDPDNMTQEQISKRDALSKKNVSLFFMKSLHGFPTGIAKACFKLQDKFPLRIWLVDNSGSMQTGDGKRFFHGKGKVNQMLNCRRWDELADAVSNHAALAKDLGSPMIFRLLNDPNLGREDLKEKTERLPQVLGICARKKYSIDNAAEQVNAAATLMKAAATAAAMEAGDAGDTNVNANGNTSKWSGLSTDTASLSTANTGSKWSIFHSKYDQIKKENDAKATLEQIAVPTGTAQDLNTHRKNKRAVPEHSWEGVWEIDVGQKDHGRDLQWMDRAQKDLELLRRVMETSEPRYKTPLAGHMVAIHDQVEGMLSSLKDHQQKVVIVIATDGIPNDRDMFLGAIHMLQKLPVQFIVRLCTDDEAAIHFWNTLELDYRKLDIEIVDDFEVEAEAVASMNPWFNYSMPLQRAREFGVRHPLITTLKERPLTHDELRDFCALLFGVSASRIPHPKEDWETFYTDVEALLTRESRQWSPVLSTTRPWISIQAMADQYGGKREKLRQVREELLNQVEEHAECGKPMEGNTTILDLGKSRIHMSGSGGIGGVADTLGCACIIL